MRKLGIVAGLIAVVAVAAFGIWWFLLNPARGLFPKKTNPLSVTPALSSSKTASKSVGAKGGEVALTTDTADFKLSLPENSVNVAETVKITQITGIEGLPAGAEFVAGVVAEPDGLLLNVSGYLDITLPAAASTESLLGFAYEAGGQNFHYLPVRISGNTARLPLTGFSGYGLIEIPEYQVPPYVPSTTASQAKQYIANIVQDNLREDQPLDGETDRRIINILRGWYNAAVKPGLEAAAGDDSALDQALREYIEWWQLVGFLGYDEDLGKEQAEAEGLIERALTHAADESSRKCVANKDVDQAARLVWLAKIAFLFDAGDPEGIYDKALNCANFELVMTSSISLEGISSSAEARVPLFIDRETLLLEGSGTITESDLVIEGVSCSGAQTYPITVDPTLFSAAGSPGSYDISVPITIDSSGATYTCKNPGSTLTLRNWEWWFDDFDRLHEGESSISERGVTYVIRDWEHVGQNGVFARKVYNRGSTENTTFELIHKPQN
ncbi:MAG: hypothetical protein XU08_C0003G0020 [candidate division WWE3 bacterium CSP1-7]|uniref:Uncharacterized protein n=1 Tax=candidate division WWE3 bacterium CSP1-7 TaxID=1576480 RepID=A0A0T5ZXB7_UNCKA|nr:MAG: hypothetical protein XU08_C0003G0020 [candidate division WWE3 bacterium CSP1-7]